MEMLTGISLSAERLRQLRRELEMQEPVLPFSRSPEFASTLASYGIFREVGTVNDALARFIFNPDTGLQVGLDSLKAELVEWRNQVGVRIWSTESDELELRVQGLHDLLHPKFSFDERGVVKQLVLFPHIIAQIAAMEGVELTVVKSWAQNSIFGGFDPAVGYYQTNFWELASNDVLQFARLVSQGQLALLGTHDVIAHVAGAQRESWSLLKGQARAVIDGIRNYLQNAATPSVASLIIPYTIGVVLDDLAQPPTYGSKSHALFLDLLLDELRACSIRPERPMILARFPERFAEVIRASRDHNSVKAPSRARALVAELGREILSCAVLSPA